MEPNNPYGPQEEPKIEEPIVKKREPKREKNEALLAISLVALAGVLVGALLVWFLIPSVVTNLPATMQRKQLILLQKPNSFLWMLLQT